MPSTMPNVTGAVVAAATFSRKAINQDAFAIATNAVNRLRALVVADGLGSHYGAESASVIAASSLARSLEGLAAADPVDLPSLFGDAQREIQAWVEKHTLELPLNLDWQNAFGTTLLCATDTPGYLLLAYVGNGAILHIRGNFNAFPASQLLPWCAVNYLNPHSVWQQGKNVLYKLLSPRSDATAGTPSIVQLQKDCDFFGDIMVVCSDGITSLDQTPMGLDDKHQIWISGEQSVAMLLDSLKTFFASSSYTDEALQCVLQAYLTSMNERNIVTDDCTLGVLITQRALQYQSTIRSDDRGVRT